MGKPANDLTRAVTSYLLLKGWFVWKGGCGGTKFFDKKGKSRFAYFGTPGACDLFAIKGWQMFIHGAYELRPHKLLGIEIKAGKDTQKEGQDTFQKDFEAHGGTYLIVHKTEDLDEYT